MSLADLIPEQPKGKMLAEFSHIVKERSLCLKGAGYNKTEEFADLRLNLRSFAIAQRYTAKS